MANFSAFIQKNILYLSGIIVLFIVVVTWISVSIDHTDNSASRAPIPNTTPTTLKTSTTPPTSTASTTAPTSSTTAPTLSTTAPTSSTTAPTSSTTATTSSTTAPTSSTTAPTSSTKPTTNPPTGCEINPTANNASPLLIYNGTSTIIYPEPESATIKFATNQLVEFACVGSSQTIFEATCVDNQTFLIDKEEVEWANWACPETFVAEVLSINVTKDDPMQSCYEGQEENSNTRKIGTIGFKLTEERSIVMMKICFDLNSQTTLFSSYNLTSSIDTRARNGTTPTFEQDYSFFEESIKLDDLYKNSTTTLGTILGNITENYINKSIFINKGHLGARADFMYEALQIATYRYINVAPQWNTINGGNWNQIEISVRNYSINLQIWTGTYGICTLANLAGTKTDLYLFINETYNAVPIPDVFWKLVYNPINQQGIVLVTNNNPYKNDTDKICSKDVSDQALWLNLNQTDYTIGYSYSCEYSDTLFQENVFYVPKINVTGLLV